MNDIKSKVKNILNQHNCRFINMLSECRVLWMNKNGIIRDDDIFTLANMTESAWDFWVVS